MTRATNPRALHHLLQAGMNSVPQNEICRTCQVNCWLCAPSSEPFIPPPEERGRTGRRDVAGVGFAPLKSDRGGKSPFLQPLLPGLSGAQWNPAALPGPAAAPRARPVALELASAPLGIPGPPATPARSPASTGSWEKPSPWQPETKLGLSRSHGPPPGWGGRSRWGLHQGSHREPVPRLL